MDDRLNTPMEVPRYLVRNPHSSPPPELDQSRVWVVIDRTILGDAGPLADKSFVF
jgi:hypothetical protein